MGRSSEMKRNKISRGTAKSRLRNVAVFILLFALLTCSSFAQTSPALRAAKQYTDQHSVEILKDFAQFLSMPDVAHDTPAMRQDIDKNAAFIKSKLEQRGVAVQILNV